MDPLSDLMNLVSAQSYVTVGLSTGNAWAAQFPEFDGLKVICIRKGKFWLKTQVENHRYELGSGDGIILTNGQPFVMYTEHGNFENAIDSKKIPHVKNSGVLNYGDDQHILLAGRMSVNPIGDQLVKKELPAIIPFSTGTTTSTTLSWLLKQLLHESTSKNLGTMVASNYLMHLMIIEILRVWITNSKDKKTGWFKAMNDQRIAKTIGMIHQDPSRNWSLDELTEIS